MPEQARRMALEAESGTERSRRLVFIMLAIGAILLAITVGTALRSGFLLQDATAKVEHTLTVSSELSELSAKGERIETARRGYLIQPRQRYVDIIRTTHGEGVSTVGGLQRLLSDNPAQMARLARIAAMDRERQDYIERMIATPAFASEIRNSEFLEDRGTALTRSIRAELATMISVEEAAYKQRSARQQDALDLFYIVGGAGFVLLVAVLLGAISIVSRSNRALSVAEQRLRAINEDLEDTVKARTSELRRANEEIQRFAYIVSHDLRSPLVNVLGFTSELDEARKTLQRYLRRFAEDRPEVIGTPPWIAVEEDIPESLAFIRSSTEKMDRLINSILELSRQGRRQLRPERLDMTELARAVADTLRQRAEQAGATVTVSALPAIENDRIAIEQMLSNLAENAIKYARPDRAGDIRIEGRDVGSDVEIDVIDNGRGIAPADHERIFELFRRAGQQDQPGEGIGLANVRALAYRLGGRITVESELGKGSRFRLILPKNFVAAENA